jgi:hypothetical protein
MTALTPTAKDAVSASPRTFDDNVIPVCLGSSGGPVNRPGVALANNVITAHHFTGTDPRLGNTRLMACDCKSATDLLCIQACPRGDVVGPDPGTWALMTLEKVGAPTANPRPSNHFRVPHGKMLEPNLPSNEELGWRYWADLSGLGAVTPGLRTVANPVIWSWTRNYGAVTRPAYLDPVGADALRRQDIRRFELRPAWGRPEHCPADFVGALPTRTFRVPLVGGCLRCGKFGTYRKLAADLDGDPRYVAPHLGVGGFLDYATPDVAGIADDADLDVVVATDHGWGMGVGRDRAAVYKKSTHELVGTLFENADRKLAFRSLSVGDVDLVTPLAPGVAISARRAEIRFFDAASYQNLSLLAMRGVNLDSGLTYRSTLHIVGGQELVGPVVAAAYRELDDAYYILSRGDGKVRLHRVSVAHAVEAVYTWNDLDAGAMADLSSDEDGHLAVTRRGPSGFQVVVFRVDPTQLTPTVVSHVSGSGPLALGAAVSPEGVWLDRPGPHADRSYPFAQVGEPDIVYHDVQGTAWTSLFQ